jgi:hypothetical protein
VLVDGDLRRLRAVKAAAKRVGAKITVVIAVIHVIEYLGASARAIFGETSSRSENCVGDRVAALLTGQSGGDVARTIRGWLSRADPKKVGPARREEVERTCAYLSDRTRRMKYAEALEAGLPTATGIIEGACRYRVKDSMDITGARWSLSGAEAVLRLRAIRASGDFDAYGEFHLTQEPTRDHAERYADATVPDVLPPPRPRHAQARWHVPALAHGKVPTDASIAPENPARRLATATVRCARPPETMPSLDLLMSRMVGIGIVLPVAPVVDAAIEETLVHASARAWMGTTCAPSRC